MTAYSKTCAQPISQVGLCAEPPRDCGLAITPLRDDRLGRFVVTLKVGGLQDVNWTECRESIVDLHRYLGEMLGEA